MSYKMHSLSWSSSDYEKCEFRPSHVNKPKTRIQVASIRQIGAGSRLRVQAEAGYCKAADRTKSHSNLELPLKSTSTSSISIPASMNKFNQFKPSSTIRVQSSPNPYEILGNQKGSSDTQILFSWDIDLQLTANPRQSQFSHSM